MAASFMFATGIENSYPTIVLPDGTIQRVDEMEKAGHYQHWREDFQLVKDLGIRYLRYGPPYYRAHLGPGHYDWSFSDETMNELQFLGITPIVDLCHFGVPDWLENFQNPDFVAYFPEYVAAFARRYPWVKFYTPVNEMFITARFSAELGWWNERRTSDRDFVTALKHIVKANILASEAIHRIRSDATIIQSESSEYFHPINPDARECAHILNIKRFLALDLNYGYNLLCATMYEYLLDNGMTREEFHYFLDRRNRHVCIMGNDYYQTNEHIVHPDGSVHPCDMFGYYVITRQYYDRYKLPVMHTETNISEESGAVRWLEKQWSNMIRLREDGVPIVGFTWYSLTDQVDWDTLLREDNQHVNHLGLFDLDRHIRPVGEAYRELIQKWQGKIEVQTLCL